MHCVISRYPFGMLMGERTFSGENYRWGFNGQEKDDEVSGNGNSNTAEYWQYDSRLGRRWNVDPVIKSELTSYHSFSNNPIIFVDPLGNTDYYNLKGKKIGSDGISNNQNYLVLDKSTQGLVKKATRRTQNICLNEKQLLDVFRIPEPQEIGAMRESYIATESDDRHEEGFVSGYDVNGNLQIEHFESSPGRYISEENRNSTLNRLIKRGVSNVALIFHTHPSKPENDNELGGFAKHSGSFISEAEDVGLIKSIGDPYSGVGGYQSDYDLQQVKDPDTNNKIVELRRQNSDEKKSRSIILSLRQLESLSNKVQND
jgi:RHS repeat-associated protein